MRRGFGKKAYRSTAIPLPTYSLNFTTGTLSPDITFTRSSSATYFDSTGTLKTATTNTPRFDYNPSTLAALGLLIEEARTNSLRNNSMAGAAAGTPGTAPTYWVMPGSINGLTQQIVGTGTENGITYIDIRYSGTTNTSGSHGISFEAANQIAAASGQTWTRSAWFKIAAGSTANLNALNHNTQGRNAANTAFTETFATDIAPSLTGTLKRFSTASTLADPNTAFARSQIQYFYNSGVAIDLTLRIGLPQFEQGAFVTSVIATTSAAATRSADVATISGANFTKWFQSGPGTVYAVYTYGSGIGSNAQAMYSFSDGGETNRLIAFKTTLLSQQFDETGGGGSIVIAGAAANTTYKSAFAYDNNNMAVSVNGGTVGTDTSVTISNKAQLNIGDRATGGRSLNGWISAINYYPYRLPDINLQTLTS